MKNFDRNYINIALEFAKMSSCVSHQVGCIIVKDGRILSTGYNGTPAGYKFNCDQVFPNYNPATDREKHREFSAFTELHSEINGLIYAARKGISIEGASLYCTTEPCKDCMKALIGAGIRKIIFLNQYDSNDSIREKMIEFYRDCGIDFGRFDETSNRVVWF